MIQGLFRRHLSEFCCRGFAKWTAGRRENKLRHFIATAGTEALVRAVVLAVDRDELGSRRAPGVDNDAPAGNQDFFICKTDAFGEANRLVSGFQALDSDDR